MWQRMEILAKRLTKYFITCLCLAVSSQLYATNWTLTPSSQVSFGIKSVGLSIVEGRFNQVQSQLVFDPELPQRALATLVLDVESLSLSKPSLKGLILGSEFFDAAEFKQVTFKSTSIKPIAYAKYQIYGNLTLRGVTKPVIFDTTLTPTANNAKLLDVRATTTINRSDFGMRKALGGVGEQVTIQLKGQWKPAQ